MVGFLNSHGTAPKDFEGRFIDLTFGVPFSDLFDNEDRLNTAGLNIDGEFGRRARTNLEDLLVDDPQNVEALEAEATELDDDFDFLCLEEEAPEHRSGLPFDPRYDLGSDPDDQPMTVGEMIDFYSCRTPCDEYRLPAAAWIEYHYGGYVEESDINEDLELFDINEPVLFTPCVISMDRQVTPSFHSVSRCNITKETKKRLRSIEWRNHRRSHLRNAGRKLAKWRSESGGRPHKDCLRYSRRQFAKDVLDNLATHDPHLDAFFEMKLAA